ncbi:MAG TPA: radical SAM protein, partial [bacterium]|nr:radical SAM protein [bacterium]
RVMYLYPSLFSDALIETIATHPKICKYIDMPVQHISDRILKTMRRNTGKKQTTDLLYKIKTRMPDVALRTSMIVGYPGETEADFEELCDFVREFKFDRLGVFIYSQEEGTYAYDLEPQVEEAVKKERFNRLMEIQREISHAHNMEKIDQTFRVMIDTQSSEHYIGRTMSDAPEIDNEVIITSSRKLKPGQFVDVKITDATEYDLYAEAL